MTTPAVLTFQATPVQMSKLLSELQANGTDVVVQGQGSVSIHGRGITASAAYVEPVLTVTITDKPWWVSIGMISKQIVEHLG